MRKVGSLVQRKRKKGVTKGINKGKVTERKGEGVNWVDKRMKRAKRN